MEKLFSGVEFQRTVSKFRKTKRMSYVHVSTKRKNRKFHVVVMQRRQRTVQKCVMLVQSYCFANPKLLLYVCRSCCRHCCHCLSSLILLSALSYVLRCRPPLSAMNKTTLHWRGITVCRKLQS